MENPYTLPFKVSSSVPEGMLLLPAWWIQLRKHTALRLSLSISCSARQDCESDSDWRPWKRLWAKGGYIEWFNYYSAVMCQCRPSMHKQLRRRPLSALPFVMCSGQSCTRIMLQRGFSQGLSEWLRVRRACQQLVCALRHQDLKRKFFLASLSIYLSLL